VVINHLLAELATSLKCGEGIPPQFVLDWDSDNTDQSLEIPDYEPRFHIRAAQAPALEMLGGSAGSVCCGFWLAVSAVHWIDAHRFCTNPEVIFSAAASVLAPVELFVHTTPRQMERPWIKVQLDVFLGHLSAAGLSAAVNAHLTSEDPSLWIHFRVLEELFLA
jgi:hypothetical protein